MVKGGSGNPSTLELEAGGSEPRSASATEFEHCLSFVGPGLKHKQQKRGNVPGLETNRSKGLRRPETWPVPGGLWEGKMLHKEIACYQEVPLMTHSLH